MKKIFAVAITAFVIALSGCAIGDESLSATNIASVDKYIVDGKTTMTDVKAAFGDTDAKKQTMDGGEFWYYSVVNHYGVTATIKTLAVTFDDKGIVTNHVYGKYGPS